MEKLSLKKKLLVIRLYFEGLPYGEIAVKAGLGKGSVSNIILELKAGKFPQYSDLSEQLDMLRELTVDLKRTGCSPVQAAVGGTVLSRLQELGVEPNEIEGLSALCQTLNTAGIDIPFFVRVAMDFEAERERTGLSVDELETKVKDLGESVNRLEPLAREIAQKETHLTELNEQSESLGKEIAELEEHKDILKQDVKDKEQREAELSNRNRDLEDRVQSNDERLAVTRKDLKELSGIGISPENLTAFTQRLKVVGQRHGMKPEVIYRKLMDELKQLDEGLGLDTITKVKKQELRKLENTVLKAEEESAAISSTNETLRQEQSELKAVLLEERSNITNNIEAINRTAENTTAKLETVILEEREQIRKVFENIITATENTIAEAKQNLRSAVDESASEVNRLKNQALELGVQLGQFNELVESNKWLKGLQALVKGDDEVEPDQVRVILITVIKSALVWLDNHTQDAGSQWLLRPTITNLIGELERWKP
ncbi:hypothetical protein ACFLWI_05905 [Chloroflexota bacterium]